ncbi:unnamed protein product [Ranitomeya imitator]|uniref:Uncharacterized protein n=1 Tax=Ranitomeya imitator TaxID=111125 RepID=A0ABN9MKT4_9NEOB|nr:unnamed protein product [Ranitomeya imitator]
MLPISGPPLFTAALPGLSCSRTRYGKTSGVVQKYNLSHKNKPSHGHIDGKLTKAYVLPVKVEMEIVIQQYEKAKLIQEEQLERLTQMCQEQAFEIRQLRAHLAQQDLDLVAERERALKLPHELQNKNSRFMVVGGRDSDEEATENLTELSHGRTRTYLQHYRML